MIWWKSDLINKAYKVPPAKMLQGTLIQSIGLGEELRRSTWISLNKGTRRASPCQIKGQRQADWAAADN